MFYMKVRGCKPKAFDSKTRGFAEAAREVAWDFIESLGELRFPPEGKMVPVYSCDERGEVLNETPFKIQFDLKCTWTNPREVAGDKCTG